MKGDVAFHTENSQRIYDLACDENMWKFWTDEEKSNFMRDPPLVNAINQGNWDIAKLKAIERIVEYIRNGKITFKESYYYQDIGAGISEVQIEEGDGFLTPEVLDKLIEVGNRRMVCSRWDILKRNLQSVFTQPLDTLRGNTDA